MKIKSDSLLKAIGTSCVAAGLVSTWDVPAEAQEYTFSGQITPTSDLTDVFFLVAAGICYPGGGVFAQEISPFIQANTTASFNLSFDSIPAGLPVDGFTMLGLYDPVNGGVSVAYDPGQAAGILAASPLPDWSSPFLPGCNSDGSIFYQYIGASESDAATALGNNLSGGAPFIPFAGLFPGNSTDPANPSQFTLVEFSGAANGGSGFASQVVPEPSAGVFLAAGSALFAFMRLRRRGGNS